LWHFFLHFILNNQFVYKGAAGFFSDYWQAYVRVFERENTTTLELEKIVA